MMSGERGPTVIFFYRVSTQAKLSNYVCLPYPAENFLYDK